MTQFTRTGFTRTSKNGVIHWVREHNVERTDWANYTAENGPNVYRTFLDNMRVQSSRTAWFVDPNANCPVCGALVYFYQNEFGSRVCFDELGPPWPKHPCTNAEQRTLGKEWETFASSAMPEGRSQDDISSIRSCIEAMPEDSVFDFKFRFGSTPLPLGTVVKRIRSGAEVFLILKMLAGDHKKRLFVAAKALPRCLKQGSIVGLRDGRLSFFNNHTMESNETDIRRIKNASRFIDDIIAASPLPEK
jgi:hypothetical protein